MLSLTGRSCSDRSQSTSRNCSLLTQQSYMPLYVECPVMDFSSTTLSLSKLPCLALPCLDNLRLETRCDNLFMIPWGA